MILNKKGNILITVVIPIAIFLVVGGIYLYQQSVKTNKMLQDVREKEDDLNLTEEVILEKEEIEQEGIVELLEEVTSEEDKKPLKKEEETSTERELSNEEIIKNAFYGNGSAFCDLNDDVFGRKSEIYIKRGNFLIKGIEEKNAFYPETTLYSLYKDGFYYTWDDYKKEGEFFSPGEGIMNSVEEINFFILAISKSENVEKCSSRVISDSYFSLPSKIEFLDGMENVRDTMIMNQINQVRSLMEIYYSFENGYKESAELTTINNHPRNNDYQKIKEKIKEMGGELIIKFSGDSKNEGNYSEYCAYSKLNIGKGEWAYCVDSTGNWQKHKTLKFNCFSGVATNCK
jgi:hypothetical protein